MLVRLQQSILSAGWCPATSSKNEFLEAQLMVHRPAFLLAFVRPGIWYPSDFQLLPILDATVGDVEKEWLR